MGTYMGDGSYWPLGWVRQPPYGSRHFHTGMPVRMRDGSYASIDVEIAPVVAYLQTIPDIMTGFSCQGGRPIPTFGCTPYHGKPYITMQCFSRDALERVKKEFPDYRVTEDWICIYPVLREF